MKITCLGTGTPEPDARRASAGYLVEIGADRILLDCGGGVVDRLLRAGRMPRDVTHLFFSHLHSDHMMDYPRLVHAAWDQGGGRLPVFGPAPLERITAGLFAPGGIWAHDLAARTGGSVTMADWQAQEDQTGGRWPRPAVTQIRPGFAHQGEGWRLTSCSVPHAQPWLDCMAFAIEAEGRRIVYSGDAGLCAPLEALCGGADLLIHWCYRFDDEPAATREEDPLQPTPTQIATMAERARVKALVLTHIRPHNDSPARLCAARQAMEAVFSGACDIAADLTVLTP